MYQRRAAVNIVGHRLVSGPSLRITKDRHRRADPIVTGIDTLSVPRGALVLLPFAIILWVVIAQLF